MCFQVAIPVLDGESLKGKASLAPSFDLLCGQSAWSVGHGPCIIHATTLNILVHQAMDVQRGAQKPDTTPGSHRTRNLH